MKKFIAIVIVAVVCVGAIKIYDIYKSDDSDDTTTNYYYTSETENVENDYNSDNNSYDNYNNNQASTYGARVSLDTTGDYSGLQLDRTSDRNDIIGYNIRNNQNNEVASLTGDEAQVKIAVAAFNARKNRDSEAYSKLFYRPTQLSDSSSAEFVAYKVIEYNEFSESEIESLNKALQSSEKLYGYTDTVTATEYCRITMGIYQYKSEPDIYDKYNTHESDPYYFIANIYRANGQYYIYSITITQ